MTYRSKHAIVVDGLTKCYGDLRAVDDVSFAVTHGEVFAFLGPNGAGKTTTAEIIETVRTPTSGRVSVLGMDVTKQKRDIVPRIGVLPQGFNSFERITVRESLRYYSRLFGCTGTNVDRLMELTNLQDKSDVEFRRLSGGLKQRLGIATSLVNDPEVVFLDEPTTGLDPHARRAVWDVLLGLKGRGKTIFLTTHYMEEAELLADTVAIICAGRLAAMGSPEELVARNANSLRLTLKTVSAKVLQAITALRYEPVQDGRNNIHIRVRRTEDVQDILRAITGIGEPLPDLDVRKPNLEEVFLSLTRDARRETGLQTADAPTP